MNSFRALLIACAFVPAAHSQDVKPLVWAADEEGGAPYIFSVQDKDGANKQVGFEVDLKDALARELRRPIEFKQYDYKNLIAGLQQNDFDFAMNGLEVTDDRLEKVLFSKPYYAFKLQLVVRQDETRFDTLDGIREKQGKVGTLEDTAASRFLKKRGFEPKEYEGQIEPFQDLEQKALDGVLMDWPIALYYGKQSIKTPIAPPLKFVGDLGGRGYYAIAIHRNNPQLKRDLDAAIDRIWASGEMSGILKKWGIWNDGQDEFTPSGVFYETGQAEGITARTPNFMMLLLQGAWLTIQITFLSFAVAMMLGMFLALVRMYASPYISWLSTVYIEFFRGIPVLLVLVFLYYGLPAIFKSYDPTSEFKLDAFTVAIIGFGLNYAAYEAEIYRAGISSVPTGQWEAALSLGMSKPTTFQRIILPQAIRVILPPMTNDLVALFKDTSVVSVIALVDLSKQYQILTKSSSEGLVTIALATAGLYLIMSVPLGFASRYLELRWGQK